MSQKLALLCLTLALPVVAAPAALEPAHVNTAPLAGPEFPPEDADDKPVYESPAVPVYDPTQPIPDGYEVRDGPKRGLVISGGIVFGVGYGLGILGLASSRKMDIDGGWLALPVFGPLVALVTQHKTCDVDTGTPVCEKDSGTVFVLGSLFAMQAVGATLFTLGVLDKEPRLEREQPPVSLAIVPALLAHENYGLAAVGAF